MRAETKKFMEAVKRRLKEANALDETDYAALLLLERGLDSFLCAGEEIDKNGLLQMGKYGMEANPAVTIADKAQHQILSVLKEFGFTAKSRQNIKQMQPKKEDSPLGKLIKSRLNKKK